MKQEKSNITDVSDETRQLQNTIKPGEIVIGNITEIDSQGQPLVDFTENNLKRPLVAMTTQGVLRSHVGRQVALLFADGDLARPVIMGLIHSPLEALLENFDPRQADVSQERSAQQAVDLKDNLQVDDVLVDGKKVVLEAKEEIVLKCGESSITLTKAGKVLIRGKYLLNRSSGVNRIMGGSVQVN